MSPRATAAAISSRARRGILATLEREEERAIRVLEAMGEDVDRRPNADAAVVAMDDAALEAAA